MKKIPEKKEDERRMKYGRLTLSNQKSVFIAAYLEMEEITARNSTQMMSFMHKKMTCLKLSELIFQLRLQAVVPPTDSPGAQRNFGEPRCGAQPGSAKATLIQTWSDAPRTAAGPGPAGSTAA